MTDAIYTIEYSGTQDQDTWLNIADEHWSKDVKFQQVYTSIREVQDAYKLAMHYIGKDCLVKKIRIKKTEAVHTTVAESGLMYWELEKLLSSSLLLKAEDYFYRVDDVCLSRQRFKIVSFNSGAPRHNRSYSFFRTQLEDNILSVYALDDYLETFRVYVPFTKSE